VLGCPANEVTPASITDSRIAPPYCSMMCRFTVPARPARPSGSVPDDPIWIETPSGRMIRVQTTKARDWPCAAALLYSPITRLPRGINTAVPSKPRTSRLTTARA